MKPIIILYTELISPEEASNISNSMSDILVDYHLLHIQHEQITIPKVEIASVSDDVNPETLKQLGDRIIQKLTPIVTQVSEIPDKSQCCPVCHLNDAISPDDRDQYLYCMRCDTPFTY